MRSAKADDSAQAASAAAGQQIDLDIVNANLLSVVRMLRIKSGAQIVVAGGDSSYQPVTLTVSGTLSDVLHYVAVSAGATVSRDSDGVYVFRPAGSSADTGDAAAPAAPQATADPQDADAPPPTENNTILPPVAGPVGPMHVERIVLQNVDPNFILKMINYPQGYRDTNPYHDPDAAESFGPIPGQNNYQGNIIQGGSNLNALAQSIQPTASEQPSVPMNDQPIGSASSLSANRSTTDSASQAQQYVTPGGGGNFFGGGGGFNPGQRGPGGFGGPGGIGGPGGANNQVSLRPEGIQSIVANEQDNSLLVTGDAQGIEDLKRIISLLDIPPKQVQIKVEFITASVTDVNQFGISWDFLPLPNLEVGTQQGSGLSSTDDTFMTFAQGNMVARLFTFLSEGHGKNISSPIITTTNNIPASIFENIQIPYVTSSSVVAAGGTNSTSNSVNFLNVPTGLTVLPRINGDNSVTLTLSPTLQVPGTAVIPNGPPPVTSEGLTTIRTVANNETMVLGGLVTKNDTNTTTKVPILGDLPIIGSLFRTRNENVNNTELLIFVTPTVLPAPNVAANLSGSPPTAETGVGVTP